MRRTGAFGENHIAADYMLSSVSDPLTYLVSRERTRPRLVAAIERVLELGFAACFNLDG